MDEKPFSIVDILIAFMAVAPLDVVEFFLSPTGLSVVLLPFDFMVGGGVLMWFAMKPGVSSRFMARGGMWAAANVIDLVPVVEALPTRTAVMAAVIWLSNRDDAEEDEDEFAEAA